MINYKGKPLFGEDSSASTTSEFFAIAGTILFWLIFLIFSFVIKPQPKKQYKEVQIVLSSTPVVQKTEEAPAPAEQVAASASASSAESVVEQVVETPAPAPEPVKKTVETPAPKKTETPKPKAQSQPKKEPAKTQSAPKPVPAPKPEETVEYAKSVEDLMAEQMNNKRKQTAFRDDLFNEDEISDDQSLAQNRTVKNLENLFSNEYAGTSVSEDSGIVKSELKKDSINENVSSGIQKSLSDIAKIQGSDISNSQGKSQQSKSGNNEDSITWANGSSARSIKTFNADLSEPAKRSMVVAKPTPFEISFSVDENGKVMRSTIEIKNEFILSEIIKKEMIEQISKWEFSRGTGISKAKFTWTLSPSN